MFNGRNNVFLMVGRQTQPIHPSDGDYERLQFVLVAQ